MAKFKVGDKVTDGINVFTISEAMGKDFNGRYKYAMQGRPCVWYSDDEIRLVTDDKKYIIATDEGHDNWTLSDELDGEELLRRLIRNGSDEYRVLTEVNVELVIKEE